MSEVKKWPDVFYTAQGLAVTKWVFKKEVSIFLATYINSEHPDTEFIVAQYEAHEYPKTEREALLWERDSLKNSLNLIEERLKEIG